MCMLDDRCLVTKVPLEHHKVDAQRSRRHPERGLGLFLGLGFWNELIWIDRIDKEWYVQNAECVKHDLGS